MRCFVSKRELPKVNWCRKMGLNFALFTPVKLQEGWAKCLSQFFVLDLGPCTFDILLKLTGERGGGYTAVWEIIAFGTWTCA